MRKYPTKTIVKTRGGRIVCLLFTALSFFAVFLLLLWFMRTIPIDSDYSNLVLEANDMIRGNVFLSDWTLTGISFITTDLLYFIVGALCVGISVNAFRIAIALMSAVLIALSVLLITEGERVKWYHLLCILLLLLPCQSDLIFLRAHTGAICWSFSAIFCANRLLADGYSLRKWYVFLTLSLALGCVGDSLTLLVGLLPIAVYGGVYWLNPVHSGERRKTAVRLLLACFAALVLSVVLDKLYFLIGGANKNTFLESKQFEPIEKWLDKANIYFNALFSMHNASFFGNRLISLKTAVYFVNTLIILCGFFFVFRTLGKLLRGRETDAVSVILSIGFLVVSIVFLITNISVDINSARYIGYIPCCFGILIARNLKDLFVKPSASALKYAALLCLLVSCMGKGAELVRLRPATQYQSGLGAFLADNGLTNGYASFWNASSVTVLTEGRVCVRAVKVNRRVEKNNWFCKNTWYKEHADFVITQPEDRYGLTKENVVLYFGNPAYVLNYEKYEILVYSHDLSPFLVGAAGFLDDGLILPNELYASENAIRQPDGTVALGQNTSLWGPYARIAAGRYRLTYRGENLDAMDYDVYSNAVGGKLPITETSRTEDRIEYVLKLDQALDDIEFRSFNKTEESIVFERIEVQAIE